MLFARLFCLRIGVLVVDINDLVVERALNLILSLILKSQLLLEAHNWPIIEQESCVLMLWIWSLPIRWVCFEAVEFERPHPSLLELFLDKHRLALVTLHWENEFLDRPIAEFERNRFLYKFIRLDLNTRRTNQFCPLFRSRTVRRGPSWATLLIQQILSKCT
jgi:hypothetical protein